MQPRLHIPGLAGLSQGPGFANLGGLGLLANRVLRAAAARRGGGAERDGWRPRRGRAAPPLGRRVEVARQPPAERLGLLGVEAPAELPGVGLDLGAQLGDGFQDGGLVGQVLGELGEVVVVAEQLGQPVGRARPGP